MTEIAEQRRPPAPLVMIFLEAPRRGAVKPKLAAALGPERATDIYRGLVERQLRAIPADWNLELQVAPADAEAEVRNWVGPNFAVKLQSDGDLGRRMRKAFAAAFARHASPVIAIVGDCPDLDQSTLHEAASRLGRADLVLGPAGNGGYYLLGLRQPAPSLFDDIPWSTPKVLTVTLARAKAAGLARELLAPKPDVDDLAGYRRYLEEVARGSSPDRLAIVIPAVNEAAHVGPAIRAAQRCFPTAPVFVVDGHSSDRTREVAARRGAHVLTASRGRGRQCRVGASAALDADWLLFLHPDTLLPDNADTVVAEFIARPHAQIATFRAGFADPHWSLRALGWCSRFDTVFTRFGCLGILIRREFYDALGGLPDWPIYEDVALLQRARAVTRVYSLPAAVVIPVQPAPRGAFWRQQWLNARLLLRYVWGQPAARLVETSRIPAGSEAAPPLSGLPAASGSLLERTRGWRGYGGGNEA